MGTLSASQARRLLRDKREGKLDCQNEKNILLPHFYLNPFPRPDIQKTVILKVSKMGAMNLALPPIVHGIIFQLLEMLSRFDTCLFPPMDA